MAIWVLVVEVMLVVMVEVMLAAGFSLFNPGSWLFIFRSGLMSSHCPVRVRCSLTLRMLFSLKVRGCLEGFFSDMVVPLFLYRKVFEGSEISSCL